MTTPTQEFGKLKHTWIRQWSPSVEEAVRGMPEPFLCPHDLFVDQLERNLHSGGAVAVIEDESSPVAVIGLRRDGRIRKRAFLNDAIPGVVGATEGSALLPAMASLNSEVALLWWNMNEVPEHPYLRELLEIPVRRIPVKEREAFWRSTKLWRHVVNARNRCEALTTRIDEPGDAEWVIRAAARKWSTDPFTVEVRLAAARRLTPLGRHVTIVLADGDRPIVGSTNFLIRDVCVSGVLYRDESVESLPTGIRIYDMLFDLCDKRGIELVDLGSTSSYKERWAPVDGAMYRMVLSPPALAVARGLRRHITRSR